MKKQIKLLVLVLSLALMIGAMVGINVAAEDGEVVSVEQPKIVSKSVYYGDQVYLYYAVNNSALAEGQELELLLYVEDATKIGFSILELTSSGTFDKNEISWALKDQIRVNGWNELWLPLRSASKTPDGGADKTAISYMRLFCHPIEGTNDLPIVYLDGCYFTNERDPIKFEQSEVVADEKYVLIDGETELNGLSYATRSTAVAKSGSYSLHSPSAVPRIALTFAPLDVSAYEGKYLHVSVYVEDATKFGGGQIELTSGGTCDVNEMTWELGGLITENGWNEFWLPISFESAKATGGKVDLTAVNFMRIYTNPKDGANTPEMYFDDIYFSMTKPE